ncbi:hypothetical protein LG047_00370 [Methylocystis sp. WRRC1]|uniref:hypothetical protein n=1 Tax=Methylocystis sp. WRRC1 TaxID=1732014 RepID=UPI001D13A175|nr:hypothetical protein [Methylocystis sp. WRRC1]MCC3243790.1 hypothetical protein [Methylocystis sp. WRRC1]
MSLHWRTLLACALAGMLLIRGLGVGVADNNSSARMYSDADASFAYCDHASTAPDDGSNALHPDCCAFCAPSGRHSTMDPVFIVAALIPLLFPGRDISGTPNLSSETQPPIKGRAISVAQPRAPPILS